MNKITKAEWKATIFILGIAIILSLWGLMNYAGVGLIFSGIYYTLIKYFRNTKNDNCKSRRRK